MPDAAAGVTCAVSVTDAPTVVAVVDTLNAVLLAVVPVFAVMVTVMALDVLPEYVLSPAYTAVKLADCALLKLTVSVADPEASVAVPSDVVPL